MPAEADVLLNLEANARFGGLQKGIEQANRLFDGLARGAERSSKDTQRVVSSLSSVSLEADGAKRALEALSRASRIEVSPSTARIRGQEGRQPVARENPVARHQREQETFELRKQIDQIKDINQLEQLGNQAKARSITASREEARISEEIKKIREARTANQNKFARGEKQRITDLLQSQKILQITSRTQREITDHVERRIRLLQRVPNQPVASPTADNQAQQSRLSSILNARAQAESQVTAEQQRQVQSTQTNVRLNREITTSVGRLRAGLADRAKAESQVTSEQNRQVQATQANVTASREINTTISSAYTALQRNIQAREQERQIVREQQEAFDIAHRKELARIGERRRARQQSRTGGVNAGPIGEVQANIEARAAERAAEAERNRRQRFIEGLREAARVREETARREQQIAENQEKQAQLRAARERTQAQRRAAEERERQEAIKRTQDIERQAAAESRARGQARLRERQQEYLAEREAQREAQRQAQENAKREQERLASQPQLPGAQGRDAFNLIQQINTARARQPQIIKEIRNSETSLQQLREESFRKRRALSASVNTEEQRILREQLGYLKSAIQERDRGLQQLIAEKRAIEANTKSLEQNRNVLNRQFADRRQATPATPQRAATPQLDVERFAAGAERQRQQELDRSRLSVENLSKAIGNYNNQLKRNQSELNKTRRGQRQFQSNMIQTLGTAAQFAGVLHSMTFALGVVSRGWRDANTRGEKFQALLPAIIGGVLRLGTSLGRVLFPTQEVLDFEQSLVRLSTQIGISEQGIADVSEQVRELAIDLARPLDALGNAAFFIQSAGHRGATAARLLDATAKSAAIALGEEVDVARLLAAAVTAYGEENLSAARASEVLLSTVREGALEAKDLTGSLGRVLAPAQTLGVEFEELGSTIAFYTRLGVNANEATTALRSVLLALLRPSRTAANSLALVGSSLEDVRASVRDRGLIRTLQDLRDVYGENTEAFTKFLGRKEAIALALALTGRNAENVDKIYRSVSDTTENLDNATERMAETMQFQLNQAMAVFRDIGITIVGTVLPPLANFFNNFANLFRSGGEEVRNFAAEMEKLVELDVRPNVANSIKSYEAFVTVLDEADDAPGNLRLIAEAWDQLLNSQGVIDPARQFGESLQSLTSSRIADGIRIENEELERLTQEREQLVNQINQSTDDLSSFSVDSNFGFNVAELQEVENQLESLTISTSTRLQDLRDNLENILGEPLDLGLLNNETVFVNTFRRLGVSVDDARLFFMEMRSEWGHLNAASQQVVLGALNVGEAFRSASKDIIPFEGEPLEVIRNHIEDLDEEVEGLIENFDKQGGSVDFGPAIADYQNFYAVLIEAARIAGDTETRISLINEVVGKIDVIQDRKASHEDLTRALVEQEGPIQRIGELFGELNKQAGAVNLSNIRNQIARTAASAIAGAIAVNAWQFAVGDAFEAYARLTSGDFATLALEEEIAAGISNWSRGLNEVEEAAESAGGAVETLSSKISTFQNRLIDTAVDQVLFIALQGDLEGAMNKVTEVIDGQLPRWNALTAFGDLVRQFFSQQMTAAFSEFQDGLNETSEETEKYTTLLDNLQNELKETAIEQTILAALSGDTAKAIEALGGATSDLVKDVAAQQAAIELLVAYYDQEYNKALEEHREALGLTSDETESYVSNLEEMRTTLVDVAVEQAVLAASQGNVAQAFDIANAAANGQVKELNSVLAAIDVVTEYIEQQFNKQWEEYVEAQENATEAAEGFISAISEMQNRLTSVAAEQVLMTALQGDVAGAMSLATSAASGQIKELNTLSAAAEVIQQFISQQFTQAWNEYTEAQQEAEEATRTFSDVLDTMSSAITRTIADMAFAAIVTGDFAKATEVLSQVNDENSKAIFAAQHVYQLLTDFINQEFTKAFEDATDEIDDQKKSIQDLAGELSTLQGDIVSIASEMIVAAAAAGDYSRALDILRITEEGELEALNKRSEAIQLVSQYLSSVGTSSLREAREEQEALEDSTESLASRINNLTNQYADYHANAVAVALVTEGIAEATTLLEAITSSQISEFNKFGEAVNLISSYIKGLGTETSDLVGGIDNVSESIQEAINNIEGISGAFNNLNFEEQGRVLSRVFKDVEDAIDAAIDSVFRFGSEVNRITFDEFKEQLSDLERATSRALEDQDDAIKRLERSADRASEHLTGEALRLFNENQRTRIDQLRDAFEQARKDAERNLEDRGERADDIADAIRKAFEGSEETNEQISTIQELIAALKDLNIEINDADFSKLVESSEELPAIFSFIKTEQEEVTESTEKQITSIEELLEALKEFGRIGGESIDEFHDKLNNNGTDPYEVLRQQTIDLAEDLKDEPIKSLEEVLAEIKTVLTPQFQESLGNLFDKYEVTVDFNQSAYDQALAELDKEFEVQAEIDDGLITEEELRKALEAIQGIKLEVPTELDEVTDEELKDALQIIADAKIEIETTLNEITEEERDRALAILENSDPIEFEGVVNVNDDDAQITIDNIRDALEALFEEFDGREIQLGLSTVGGSGGGSTTSSANEIVLDTAFVVNLDTAAIDAAYNDIERITEEYNRFIEGQGGTEADPGAVVQIWTGYRFDGSANAFAREKAEDEIGTIIREYGEFVSGQGGTESDPGAIVQAWTGYTFSGQESAFARDAAQKQITENIETYGTFVSGIGGTEADPGAVVQYWTGYNFDGTANATARTTAESEIQGQVTAHKTTIDTNSNTSATPDNIERHWKVTAIDTTDTVTNTSSITGGVGALDTELEAIRMSLGLENIDYMFGVTALDQTNTTENTNTINTVTGVPKMELDTIQMNLGIHDVTYPFAVMAKGKEEGVTTQVGSAYDHIVNTFVKPELSRKGTALRESNNIYPVPFPFQIVPRNPGASNLDATGGKEDYGTGTESKANAADAYDAIVVFVKEALENAVPTEIYPVDFPFQLVPKDEAGLSVAGTKPAFDKVKDDVNIKLGELAELLESTELTKRMHFLTIDNPEVGDGYATSADRAAGVGGEIVEAVNMAINDIEYEDIKKERNVSFLSKWFEDNGADSTEITNNADFGTNTMEWASAAVTQIDNEITTAHGNFIDVINKPARNVTFDQDFFETISSDGSVPLVNSSDFGTLTKTWTDAAVTNIDNEITTAHGNFIDIINKPPRDVTFDQDFFETIASDGSSPLGSMDEFGTLTKEWSDTAVENMDNRVQDAFDAFNDKDDLRKVEFDTDVYEDILGSNVLLGSPSHGGSTSSRALNTVVSGLTSASNSAGSAHVSSSATFTKTLRFHTVTVITCETQNNCGPGGSGGGGSNSMDDDDDDDDDEDTTTTTTTGSGGTTTTDDDDDDDTNIPSPGDIFLGHAGGIVLPRPGGTPSIIGEAGQPEAVIPLERGLASILGHNIPNVADMQMATMAGVSGAFEGILPQLIQQQSTGSSRSNEMSEPQEIKRAIREGMIEALTKVQGRRVSTPTGTNFREAAQQANAELREGSYNWGERVSRRR